MAIHITIQIYRQVNLSYGAYTTIHNKLVIVDSRLVQDREMKCDPDYVITLTITMPL